MNEIEENVRQQLLPRFTGKNHVTDEDSSLFAIPPRMGGLDLLINPDFSRNYERLRVICDPIENTYPEIAETKQALINRNTKTERQIITLLKKSKILKIAHQKKS